MGEPPFVHLGAVRTKEGGLKYHAISLFFILFCTYIYDLNIINRSGKREEKWKEKSGAKEKWGQIDDGADKK